MAQCGTAAHVEKIVRAWRQVDRQAEAKEAIARHTARTLQVYPDETGMFVVRGRLEAAREELDRQRRTATGGGPALDLPTAGQRQADALGLVAETALAKGLDPGQGSERYQVVVHVDAAALADPDQPGQSALEDGVSVSAETSRRLACDATRVLLRYAGDGELLDVGRRTRVIPPALRRALQARDRGCRFPGCGVRHAQGHHLHHWVNGGPTRLDNLVLLCRFHHRAVHEEGYQVERDVEGRLQFRTPRGWPIPEVPPPPSLPADPMQALVAANRANGLTIDARTSWPHWFGERLDLHWAISVLYPAANPPSPRIGDFAG